MNEKTAYQPQKITRRRRPVCTLEGERRQVNTLIENQNSLVAVQTGLKLKLTVVNLPVHPVDAHADEGQLIL